MIHPKTNFYNMKKRLLFITFHSLLCINFSSYAASIQRVNVDSSGTQSNNTSFYAAISNNGRFVTFSSRANNLVGGDINNVNDVFIHDRNSSTTTRISHSSHGAQGNADSDYAKTSADGRIIVFESLATNLIVGDTNAKKDIFVRNRDTGTTTRISINNSGIQGNGESSRPTISADGQFIAFTSEANNLVSNDTNGEKDIFVHDRNTGITKRVNLSSIGEQANGVSSEAKIAADGRFVMFNSFASNLVTGDTNDRNDAFIFDLNTNTTARVSVGTSNVQGNDTSYGSNISSDGRFIVFSSHSTNLAPNDTNAERDIFLRDRNNGTTIRVNLSSNGLQADESSYTPSISDDGNYVTFYSTASNLIPEGTSNTIDAYIHNVSIGTTSLLARDIHGNHGDSRSFNPSISADGRFVVFISDATNLVEADTNEQPDIFVTALKEAAKNDFDADGRTDILWRHAVSGEYYLYMMDGLSISNSGSVGTISNLNWKIVGSGDFNADGTADILWRHATSGRNYIYSMSGSSILDYGYVNTVADLNWKVAGIGDFDGDNKADILWRNSSTGQNYLYFMDGATPKAYAGINTVDDLDWQIQGVDDFNGDGYADILWRHATTGQNHLYMMNGSEIMGSGLINTVADLSWKIAGVGDFDGDNKADILWKNNSTGQNYLYLMDGVTPKAYAGINTVADLNWQIKNVNDFNGDGMADILWRHAATGENHLYMMNSNAIMASGTINTVPDFNWKIQ